MSPLRGAVYVEFWSFLTYILLGSAISINISQCKRLYLPLYLPDFWQEVPGPVYMVADNVFSCKPLFFILVCVFLHFHFFCTLVFTFYFFHLHYFFDFFFSKFTIYKVAKYFSIGDNITVIMIITTVIIHINLINRTAIIILILLTSPCIRCPVMFHVVIPLPSLLPSPCWLTYHTAAWKWTPLNKKHELSFSHWRWYNLHFILYSNLYN